MILMNKKIKKANNFKKYMSMIYLHEMNLIKNFLHNWNKYNHNCGQLTFMNKENKKRQIVS